MLSSAAAEPGDSAALVQAVFADAVTFSGEFRTEDAVGRAGLCLEILRGEKGGLDRREHHAVTVTGSQDWSRHEITVPVPPIAASPGSASSWPTAAGSATRRRCSMRMDLHERVGELIQDDDVCGTRRSGESRNSPRVTPGHKVREEIRLLICEITNDQNPLP